MDESEDLIAAIAKLDETVSISNQQVNSRLRTIELRLSELSSSLAVVLNRSADNKKELASHKKKMEIWHNIPSN